MSWRIKSLPVFAFQWIVLCNRPSSPRKKLSEPRHSVSQNFILKISIHSLASKKKCAGMCKHMIFSAMARLCENVHTFFTIFYNCRALLIECNTFARERIWFCFFFFFFATKSNTRLVRFFASHGSRLSIFTERGKNFRLHEAERRRSAWAERL